VAEDAGYKLVPEGVAEVQDGGVDHAVQPN
jgi:hypothetical protein